mgnify:CR=1 FL=1
MTMKMVGEAIFLSKILIRLNTRLFKIQAIHILNLLKKVHSIILITLIQAQVLHLALVVLKVVPKRMRPECKMAIEYSVKVSQ